MNAPVAGVSRLSYLEALREGLRDALRGDVEFREQFDFDSMDVFDFAAALHAEFGWEIPEREYRQRLRLNRCLAYLDAHAVASAAPPGAS